jgi:hypothetical protein
MSSSLNIEETTTMGLYIDNIVGKQSKSNKAEQKYPFGNCKVCNDQSTGFHYGVSTCEGCKGFYKRGILSNIKYKCSNKSKNCTIDVHNRNKCKYCRFKKCIEVGMSVESIYKSSVFNSYFIYL